MCVDIRIDALSEHAFWANLALEVERGGVFVATYRPLSIGTQVELCLTLPDGGQPVTVCGVVRWTRPHLEGSDGVAGLRCRLPALAASLRLEFPVAGCRWRVACFRLGD